MKKILIILTAVLTAACTGGRKPDYRASEQEFEEKAIAIFGDSTLTADQQEEAYKTLCLETYLQHSDDSLGLDIFPFLITNYLTPDEALALYEKSSDLVRENEKVKVKMESVKYQKTVVPGKPYKNVAGVDPLSGDSLNLRSFIGGDKPVLVDFWASWCSPCRMEIREHLLDLAAGGKVQIVGVAVWEDSVDDTRKAMSDLGITWPVIYTGGRSNSPTIKYGVIGIPTLFLLGADGTIIASGHSVTDFADKL